MRAKFLCGRRILWAFHLAAFVTCISAFSEIAAQPLTHTVKKGDTLYSISQRYLGAPELWPSLWEMNPFITNPHLLKPGDLVRVGALQPAVLKSVEAVIPVARVPEEKPTGISVGSITSLNAIGFLSDQELSPWSVVESTDSQRLLLAKGDFLFLDLAERDWVKTGDEFSIVRPLSRVTHVLTGEDEGVLYSARAKVILRERTVRNVFRAEISENYMDVKMGDLIVPFKSLPSCVKPLPTDLDLRGVVIAGQHQLTAFGRNSVVYLDSGRNKGLLPGSMLDLVRFNSVPDPDRPKDLYQFFQVKTFEELCRKLARETIVYEKVVGRMIVLDAGPRTATALVLSASESLMVGTFFRGSSWADTAGSPSPLLSCPARQ